MGEGQDHRRSPGDQEHRDRQGTRAAASENPLLGAGGRRHSRGHRRLEEKAGSHQAGSGSGRALNRPWVYKLRANARFEFDVWLARSSRLVARSFMEQATQSAPSQAPVKGIQITDQAISKVRLAMG